MDNIFDELSGDLSKYLDITRLITFSSVSTIALFTSLNDLKFNRFIPNDNGNEILMYIYTDQKVKLSQIKSSVNLDVDFGDNDGLTPLRYALIRKNVELIKLLIKSGANVNHPNKYGSTPLLKEITFDNIDMVELLLKYGADVNTVANPVFTPLYIAVSNQNIEMVRLLLKYGADVNLPTSRGMTPLYETAQTKNVKNIKIAALLINAGADINGVSEEQYQLHTMSRGTEYLEAKKLFSHISQLLENK